jgi:hypothetical protein
MMSLKQMKVFMGNVFLNGENKISNVSCEVWFLLFDQTESVTVDFIRIYYEHFFFII